MHIHKRVRVSETTEEEISAMGFKHACPNCQKEFPTKRGMSIHLARWCDGGKTVRSRKGSLADKAVQHSKRKEHENELGHAYIEGQQLDNVYTFDEKADVAYRMVIAQTAFNSLSHIWGDHRVTRNMKIRLYKSAVCSAFTHACEAWTLSEDVIKMVNGFNSRCLSHITGKHYKETATHPEFNLVASVIKRRLRFAGHILRMDHTRLLQRTFLAHINTCRDGSLLHGCEGKTLTQITKLAVKRGKWARFVNSLDI